MSDIKLYKINGGVEELSPKMVNLEKELQNLIEKNMETMFGVRFLASEFAIKNGRMDSIGIDENNSPVIFEYKRSVNENVINQGLFYLDWLLDHKADFKLIVMEKLGYQVASEIDWRAPCVICIANNFNKYDLHAVNQIQRNIKLVNYKKYDHLVLFEHLNTPNFVLKEEESPLNQGGNYKSHLDKYDNTSEKIQKLCDEVSIYMESLGDDVVEHQTKHYIAFKKVRNIVCLSLNKECLVLSLALDSQSIEEEAGFIRSVKGIGHIGTGDVEIKVRNQEDFEKSKVFLDRAYNEN